MLWADINGKAKWVDWNWMAGHHSIDNSTAVRSHQSISFLGGLLKNLRWFVCGVKIVCGQGNAPRLEPKGGGLQSRCVDQNGKVVWPYCTIPGHTIPGYTVRYEKWSDHTGPPSPQIGRSFFSIHISSISGGQRTFKAFSTVIVINSPRISQLTQNGYKKSLSSILILRETST